MKTITLLVITVVAALQPAYADQCFPKEASDAVFDVVEKESSAKIGTAFSVEDDLGLFVTAYHLMPSGAGAADKKLALRKNNKDVEFDIVASGTDSAQMLQDWVLLKAKTSTRPAPPVQILYDWPGPAAISSAKIYTSTRSVRNLTGVDWISAPKPKQACELGNVSLLEISSYDKGDSGSPVFLEKQCGVAALTSRFSVPSNYEEGSRKELVRLFQRYLRRSNSTEADRLKLEQKPLDESENIVRELIKDKVLVRVVPMQCLVDGLIEAGIRDGRVAALDLVKRQLRPFASKVAETLQGLDLKDEYRTSLVAHFIESLRLNWLEMIQISLMWLELEAKEADSRELLEVIQRVVFAKEEAMLLTGVRSSFRRVSTLAEVRPERPETAPEGAVLEDFAKRNANWVPDPSKSNLGLQGNSQFAERLIPRNRVEAGIRLYEAEPNFPPDTPPRARELAREAAAAYIVSGLADERLALSPDRRAAALTLLASQIPGASPEAESFRTRMAFKALSDLPSNAPERELAAAVVVQGVSSEFRAATAGRPVGEALKGINSVIRRVPKLKF